jgi:hypothetical protein
MGWPTPEEGEEATGDSDLKSSQWDTWQATTGARATHRRVGQS